MDVTTPPTQGMKCFFLLLKQALHSCIAPKKGQGGERKFFPHPHPKNPDLVRTYSTCSAPADFQPDTPGYEPELHKDHLEEKEEMMSCGEEDDVMTFQRLPYECKLNIFSFLSASERGMAERVCHDWKNVIRSPTLWTDIDLSLSRAFKRTTSHQTSMASSEVPAVLDSSSNKGEFGVVNSKSKSEIEAEFEKYKNSVAEYVEYLKQIKPCVKSFSFSFDIGDSHDGWTQVLKNFLDSARTRNTKRASFNWKDTSAKPSALLDSSNTWSTGNYSDLMYKQRRRQRLFVSFFDSFTALVPNLEYLSLPFDWSPSSVAHLVRLGPTLVRLNLEEYFVPQPLEQSLLDRLLANLPYLEKLSIGLVLGSGLGVSGYEFSSPSLESLDLSKCQGFALMRVDLPNLKELKTSNASFPSQLVVVSNEVAHNQNVQSVFNGKNGKSNTSQQVVQTFSNPLLKPSKSSPTLSLMQSDSQKLPVPSGIPCLFNVLKRGAPSLKKLNGYSLSEDWREAFDPKLEKILHQACSCLYHHQHHPHQAAN